MRAATFFVPFFLFALLAGSRLAAQPGVCPPNVDFEQGDFMNWVCRTGSVSVVGGLNTISWTGVGEVPGRHTIISAAGGGTDPFGGFPEICPNGSNYSVRLGNSSSGAQAEGISYTFSIPASATVFSLFYYYAVVLEDPSHAPEEQPRFRARIIDLTTGSPLPCVTFDFTASASLPGFRRSPIDAGVLYKDWTPITLNLSGYAGRTIMLEFISSDCTRTGHFGYAYMDVNSNCNGAIAGSTICAGDSSITLTAPHGFQGYTWYSDITFSTILSTNQTLVLRPPPAVGSVFPVVVEPFPGFGCRDTLYATITVTQKPVSVAGPDQQICKYQQTQIGGPPVAGYSYAWIPAGKVSNALVSNPFAGPVSAPTQFIVKTTDQFSGCFSYDTMLLSNVIVDTAIRLNGSPDFCNGDPGPVLSVNHTLNSIQWYEQSAGPVAGAIGSTYQPAISGTFWAQVSQNGCTDSTAGLPVFAHPLPLPSITVNNDTGCISNHSFDFSSSSTAPDLSAMTHNWYFSDGSTNTGPVITKTFPGIGAWQAKMVSTTSFGCKDSSYQTVHVMPLGQPAFTWDSICTGRPVLFTNLSNENGSPQTTYLWDFANGDPPVPGKNPMPQLYNGAPGQVDVQLKLVSLGCETDTQVLRKTVQVNRSAPGYRYRDITVPQGSSHYLHVRDSIGNIYQWKPAIHLSRYDAQYTEFFADADDVLYTIDITDGHTCVTTDSILMQVLKKPGFYLPTAFTPNNDGLNDLIRPYLVGMNGLISFSIYDRRGTQIFHTNTYGQGWDGKYQGADMPTAVYVWMLEYSDSNNKKILEKGTLTLIR